ncbi:MAG: cysteine--tRNA ligase [Chitinispirillaceae bacterium]|nr:cysteine--tRNA ligase [Chitinispirillaceae bacterium]
MKKALYLFNTASRIKEPFEPLHDPVGIYCCGPTVYNYAHIGNLRTYIFEDVLKRALLLFDYRVNHIVNITDVGHLTSDEDTGEDKMEKGARREGKSVWDIAAHFTETFMEDIASLNILNADRWPKATDHIEQMISLVRTLEEKGFTYRTVDGIYFDTEKFPAYVEFAGLDPENLRAGERVEMGEKRNPTDFALWKFSPTDQRRQMEWESPWGTGFPGWHIECSAMSLAYLPQPIDIHCGGADHIRVHHTNEIAQTEAATGKPFVRYWLHGEFLMLDKGKMAKSGESFVTMATVRRRGIAPLAYRMFCFSAHYRSPLSFSWEGLQAAEQSLKSLRKTVRALGPDETWSNEQVTETLEAFYAAVGDDLNMPRAVAALWDCIHDTSLTGGLRRACVAEADRVLGLDLLMEDAEERVTVAYGADGEEVRIEGAADITDEISSAVVDIVSRRRTARKEKNFPVADAIRDRLGGLGITVKDLPDGAAVVTLPPEAYENDEKKQILLSTLNSKE